VAPSSIDAAIVAPARDAFESPRGGRQDSSVVRLTTATKLDAANPRPQVKPTYAVEPVAVSVTTNKLELNTNLPSAVATSNTSPCGLHSSFQIGFKMTLARRQSK
jgi:hypothetical protein